MTGQKDFYENLWQDEIGNVIGTDYKKYESKHCGRAKMTLLDTYLAAIPERESILEIGCGSGRIVVHFKGKHGIRRAYGADISEKAISFAVAHHRDCEFFVCNIDEENLPFKDSGIDIVLLCDIVEHVRDYDRLLRESIRVGKHVVIKVPLERTWLEYAKTLCGRDTSINKRHNKGHIQSFTLGTFRRYFRSLAKEMPIHVEMINEKGSLIERRHWILNVFGKLLCRTPFYRFVFTTDLGIHIGKKG